MKWENCQVVKTRDTCWRSFSWNPGFWHFCQLYLLVKGRNILLTSATWSRENVCAVRVRDVACFIFHFNWMGYDVSSCIVFSVIKIIIDWSPPSNPHLTPIWVRCLQIWHYCKLSSLHCPLVKVTLGILLSSLQVTLQAVPSHETFGENLKWSCCLNKQAS